MRIHGRYSQKAGGGLPGRRAPRPAALGRRALRHRRLAHRQVHPDHHIQCQQALYSVPSDVCPPRQEVEVRLDSKLVRIYHRGRLTKSHLRQPKGGRSTDPDDYPAVLAPYTTRAPTRLSAARRSWGRRRPNSPSVSSKAPIPGPRSGRDTSCCDWGSATPPSVWTPPTSGPSTWTSST